jgi:hypothetical protein
MLRFFKVENRTLKRHISIGVHNNMLFDDKEYGNAHVLICIYILLYSKFHLFTLKYNRIRLFRIISIPSKKIYFRPPDHVISMD